MNDNYLTIFGDDLGIIISRTLEIGPDSLSGFILYKPHDSSIPNLEMSNQELKNCLGVEPSYLSFDKKYVARARIGGRSVWINERLDSNTTSFAYVGRGIVSLDLFNEELNGVFPKDYLQRNSGALNLSSF